MNEIYLEYRKLSHITQSCLDLIILYDIQSFPINISQTTNRSLKYSVTLK